MDSAIIRAHRAPDPVPVEEPPLAPSPAPHPHDPPRHPPREDDPVPDHNPS